MMRIKNPVYLELSKTKNPWITQGFFENWRCHTLPPVTVVPSALLGLTSLFGMGRGDPQRNNHQKKRYIDRVLIYKLSSN